MASNVRRITSNAFVKFKDTTNFYSFSEKHIVSIDIDRVGEDSKFFGFPITHKATLKVINKTINNSVSPLENGIENVESFKITIYTEIDGEKTASQYPNFYVDNIEVDELTDVVTLTGYCILNILSEYTVTDLNLTTPYTIRDFITAYINILNIHNITIDMLDDSIFDTEFPNGGNFEEDATLKEGLIAVLEATQTICYMDYTGYGDRLVFKQLDNNTLPTQSVTKSDYFSLESGNTYNLGTITLVTALGDNVSASAIVPLNYNMCDLDRANTSMFNKSINESTGYTVLTPESSYTSTSVFHIDWENESRLCTFFNDNRGKNIVFQHKTIEGYTSVTSGAAQKIIITGYDFNGSTLVEEIQCRYQFTKFKVPENFRSIHKIRIDFAKDNSITELMFYSPSQDNYLNNQKPYIPYEEGRDTEYGVEQQAISNPFWEMSENIGATIEAAIDTVGEISITEFECLWRGNASLKPGHKLLFEKKDGSYFYGYILNDTLSFDGGLSEKTSWRYIAPSKTSTNLSSIGDAINQTYAKVDKVQKQIDIVAGEVDSTREALSALRINTDSISASVSETQTILQESFQSVSEGMSELTKKVEATMTPEDVQIQIKTELSNGTSSVTTATGFTFNEEGLTINKTGSEMTTNIDEDGMSVYRDNEEVLTADNQGVIAYNLHAKTFLIIGENSRFEDYEKDGTARTGCFWIGG